MTLTPEQIEQDELILAAIIAGGMASGRRVAPSLSGYRAEQVGHGQGYGVSTATGPMCAVGAGVLFAGITCTQRDANEAFAEVHGVTYEYASAVSGAFEGADDVSADRRGHAVGSAAWDFFCGDDAP
jgi:uncharacterized membrane protein